MSIFNRPGWENESPPKTIQSRKYGKKKVNQRLWVNGKECTFCGQPIYENQLSQDPRIRDREMAWCVHHACEEHALNKLDRESHIGNDRAVYLNPKTKS